MGNEYATKKDIEEIVGRVVSRVVGELFVEYDVPSRSDVRQMITEGTKDMATITAVQSMIDTSIHDAVKDLATVETVQTMIKQAVSDIGEILSDIMDRVWGQVEPVQKTTEKHGKMLTEHSH